jgi:hypothetical protein
MSHLVLGIALVTVLAAALPATSRATLAGPGGVLGDEQTSIFYILDTGEIGLDAPASRNLTSINLDSAAALFNVANVNHGVFNGSFDNVAEDNLFKATFGDSFGSLSFGIGVLPPGLTADFLVADLSAIGSLDVGGGLGPVDLAFVPEPSTVWLLGSGLLGLLIWRVRRSVVG